MMRARCGVGRFGLVALALVAAGCRSGAPGATGPAWLARDEARRLAQLERQLRGFDRAMVETGYRYSELYWAGRDANWEAVSYHARKLRLAIENGLERRPKRADSARPFLAGPLAALEQASVARDVAAFPARFEALTAGCNGCHASENVSFFEVRPPRQRFAPLGNAREP